MPILNENDLLMEFNELIEIAQDVIINKLHKGLTVDAFLQLVIDIRRDSRDVNLEGKTIFLPEKDILQ